MGRGEEIEKLTKENEELKEEINLSHQKNFNIEKQIEKLNFDHLSVIYFYYFILILLFFILLKFNFLFYNFININ